MFQILLLEPMYQKYKTESVKAVGDEVVEELDNEDLDEIIYANQNKSDTCIRVQMAASDSSSSDVTSPNMGCQLYRLSDETVGKLVAMASASKDQTSTVTGTWVGMGGPDSEEMQSIIYTRIANYNDKVAIVMVYAGITPVSATTKTLISTLWYIGGFLLLGVAILTFFMNRNIARPLHSVNVAAKLLPQGKYEPSQNTNNYLEVQELNSTLSEAAEDIQKADKAKRDLIANVSHDLRTPLTMIKGYGEMMQDLPEEKTDANLQVIIDEAQRLNALVNDLLDLSKLQENKIELQKEIFDLKEMIATEMRKYEVYVVNDGFQIEQYLDSEANILADRQRMEQVFNNFMTNAINYSGNAEHIIVRESVHNNKVHVSIQDFGEGIEESKLKDIWDRYYKIDKTHVRVSNGSGIGLSIVREILELHGAQYGVTSKVNEGSTFWFEFPIEKSVQTINGYEVNPKS